MTGFGKDPTNPFSNTISSDPRLPLVNGQHPPNQMYSNNRQARYLSSPAVDCGWTPMEPPECRAISTRWESRPPNRTGNAGCEPPIRERFYAYFSSYGNGGYDPNDVNFFTELDNNLSSPKLTFHVVFPTGPNGCYSRPTP